MRPMGSAARIRSGTIQQDHRHRATAILIAYGLGLAILCPFAVVHRRKHEIIG